MGAIVSNKNIIQKLKKVKLFISDKTTKITIIERDTDAVFANVIKSAGFPSLFTAAVSIINTHDPK